jgi:hypothetical protein
MINFTFFILGYYWFHCMVAGELAIAKVSLNLHKIVDLNKLITVGGNNSMLAINS